MTDATEQAVGNITGTWSGTYQSNEVPHPTPIVLTFQQLTVEELQETRRLTTPVNELPGATGTTVVGTYKSADGAIGTMTGTLANGGVRLSATQTTPTCPGAFTMMGRLDGNQFTWDFSGRDCLGQHEGSGNASRRFSEEE